ncbi:MAG TPA: hypothetical protein VFO39_07865 [Candidatus Sulfotelmatobacter sp.]|nr:hypothetical protein [Candidatus Sulfotelmatobacter sp.]
MKRGWKSAAVLGIAATGMLMLLSAGRLTAGAGDEKKDKANASGPTVDSGSFGIYVRGQRVITETFDIRQTNGASSIRSQLKEVAGSSPVDQKSTLEMSATGDLIRYNWSQAGGGSIEVQPSNEFLIEKIVAGAGAKPAEQPFLLPSTSLILDNNFFVQREIVAWRYLGADCKPEAGRLKCAQSPLEFGALVPQDRTSMRIKVGFVGMEKVSMHGAERELMRLNLSSEGFDWALWVDDQDHFKLMRVAIPADSTEVVRD